MITISFSIFNLIKFILYTIECFNFFCQHEILLSRKTMYCRQDWQNNIYFYLIYVHICVSISVKWYNVYFYCPLSYYALNAEFANQTYLSILMLVVLKTLFQCRIAECRLDWIDFLAYGFSPFTRWITILQSSFVILMD